MEPIFFHTDNTKKIITLLKEYGPMSKKDLAEMGEMGWATVVKIINQLTENNIVAKLGTEKIDNGLRGKRAYLYNLTGDNPLSIGIDIEYQTTTMVLTNLRGEVLCSKKTPTVIPKTYEMLKTFLLHIIKKFFKQYPNAMTAVGIGIGIPGIGFPQVEELNNIDRARVIEEWLSSKLGLPIKVSDNTNAYAIFEKWSNKALDKDDLIFISIRSGIGSSIFYHGNLIIGTRGLSGEIGHMQVEKNGKLCRCGKHGCLETIAGERNLFEQYVERVLNKDIMKIPKVELHDEAVYGLEDLFKRYIERQPEAVEIIDKLVRYLGKCLAPVIMVVDIPNVVISGHFGEYGGAIVEPLKKEIKQHLLLGTGCKIRYIPFDSDGHVLGAALLILKDYFINIRSQTI